MLDIIKQRRSVRSFLDKEVEDSKIEEIVKAGLYAPTGKNRQETAVIVIKDKEKLAKLSQINRMILGVESDTFYGANTVLLVIAKNNGFAELDGGAMMENMLLEATNQGLGSCWINRAQEELKMDIVKELFADLDINFDEYAGVGHVILGYAKQGPTSEKIIKDGRVFWVK